MPTKPLSNLGNIGPEENLLIEFRDSLQPLLDRLYDLSHEEPNSNHVVATRTGTGQSMPITVATKVLFNIVESGDATLFDTTVGRFTPEILGTYQILSTVDLPNIPSSSRVCLVIYKNGVEVWKGAESLISASVAGLIEITSATDFVEIFLKHTDGSAQDTGVERSRIKFAGYKIP